MGGVVSSVWKLMGAKKAVRIVMVGLDGAGKTTILYKLKLGEVVQTVPTIGFNVETIRYKNLSFTVWDVGGQYKIRALWRYYYNGVDAAIFVVDASDIDPDRLDESKEEIHYLMKENDLANAAVLIFANKQDLPNPLSAQEVAERLDLLSLIQRQWSVQACSAKTGDGICEGLDWIAHVLRKKNKQNPTPFKATIGSPTCITNYTCQSQMPQMPESNLDLRRKSASKNCTRISNDQLVAGSGDRHVTGVVGGDSGGTPLP